MAGRRQGNSARLPRLIWPTLTLPHTCTEVSSELGNVTGADLVYFFFFFISTKWFTLMCVWVGWRLPACHLKRDSSPIFYSPLWRWRIWWHVQIHDSSEVSQRGREFHPMAMHRNLMIAMCYNVKTPDTIYLRIASVVEFKLVCMLSELAILVRANMNTAPAYEATVDIWAKNMVWTTLFRDTVD